MKWQARAPSNIALIKYMGKTDVSHNIPSNASLSYTLPHLSTTVELELSDTGKDIWQGFIETPMNLSEAAQQRFLRHLHFIKKTYSIEHNFIVRSYNNFPADCGLASSASSFAALSLCAITACCELNNTRIPDLNTIAKLCRFGSGSACRSLFAPWALWQGEQVHAIKLPYYNDLHHHVIIVSQQHKTISSRKAHQQVLSSALYQGRPARAEARLQSLLACLERQQWREAYLCIWQEFWDMHALFETSNPPFGYLQSATLEALNMLRSYWDEMGDGPLITLDAGPNVHLLFHTEQEQIRQDLLNQLRQQFTIL
jgi:diphosphomevalonate decarboxylase